MTQAQKETRNGFIVTAIILVVLAGITYPQVLETLLGARPARPLGLLPFYFQQHS